MTIFQELVKDSERMIFGSNPGEIQRRLGPICLLFLNFQWVGAHDREDAIEVRGGGDARCGMSASPRPVRPTADTANGASWEAATRINQPEGRG